MPKIRGLTFIEVLIVVVIVGLLASLTIFMISQAQRQSRDARRKSDLVAISLAFQARYDDKTCLDLQVYPGIKSYLSNDEDAVDEWRNIDLLSTYADNQKNGSVCPFTQYLKTVPSDPRSNPSSPKAYIFNLSTKPFPGNHYLLGAKLERLSSQELAERARIQQTWENSFGGKMLAPQINSGYQYFIGN